ncbi:uncharacterized mitochondrial protein-like protein [Tanacetum coccineum]
MTQTEEENVVHTLEVVVAVKSYRCDQYGHFVSKCPERNRNHEVNLNETQEKGVYHEEGNYSYFSELNENILGRVSNVISLGQATISDYDVSIRGDYLTMGDSWGSLLIKVPCSANRLYKAPLKVGKEDTNEANPHSSSVTAHSPVHKTNPESEEDNSGSDDTPNLLVRLATIRLLIALAAGKGRKIHHLDVKTTFQNGDRKKLDSTLKEMGFLQCVHEKAVYRKVPNGEFIIVAVNVDDLFVTGTSLDLINEFKERVASQFEMSDLGELTYYLGIEVSQGNDCVEIKQERYAMKILKEARMEDCNPALCPMEPGLKLSKAEDEPEVEATQYRKMVSCLRYLLHTRPCKVQEHHLLVLSSKSYAILKYYWTRFLGTSTITWCSQKQTTVALSSCEAEFMAATAAACQAIWLREVLAEVMKNEQVIVEHVSGDNKKADPLTKALARIRFKEMRSLLSVQELPSSTQKFMG